MFNEETFKKKVNDLYNGDIELVGKFKGTDFPILIKDKYGVMSLKKAEFLLQSKPSIKIALNKTEYFMNQLREAYPEIAEELKPVTEYKKAKEKMLFETKFGLVSATPDALLAGHKPNIRSAIDRKMYMYNQLRYLYDYKYDFKILSTDRHKGKCILICPIHGEVLIDNDYIFSGCGCIECNSPANKSNILYVVKLSNDVESFYKLGITYEMKNNKLQRFKQYKTLGYNIEVITTVKFDSFEQCRDIETKLKRLIKNNLYQPKKWEALKSTETFSEDLLSLIIKNL